MFLGVTGMLTYMSYTNEERQVMAHRVRRGRVDRGLDKEPAARAAKVSSITWKRVEDAESVRDASLGKILKSLDLPDVDDILSGDQRPFGGTKPSPFFVDHSAEFSSAGLLHLLTLLWDTWREFSATAAMTLDPEMNSRLRRSMILTADIALDLLSLAPQEQQAGQNLQSSITDYVAEMFGNRITTESSDQSEPLGPISTEVIASAQVDDGDDGSKELG